MLLSSSRNAARPATSTITARVGKQKNPLLTRPLSSCAVAAGLRQRGEHYQQQNIPTNNSSSLQLSLCRYYSKSAQSFSTTSNSATTTTAAKVGADGKATTTATSTSVAAVTTTDTTINDDGVATTSNLDEILAIASMRARQISEFTRKTTRKTSIQREETTKMICSSSIAADGMSIIPNSAAAEKEAAEAADALLALTSSPTFVNVVASREEPHDPHHDLSALHSAFLSVTTWCCSVCLHAAETAAVNSSTTSNTHTRTLHQKLIELTERAAQLRLPLHLPLYSQIANALSTASCIEGKKAIDISNENLSNSLMDLIKTMKHSLDISGPIDSIFYSKPLLNLVKYGQIRGAIDFMKGMMKEEEGFHHESGILKIEYNVIIELLSMMEKRAMSDMKNGTQTLNESDAMELALLLQEAATAQHEHQNKDSLADKDGVDDNDIDNKLTLSGIDPSNTAKLIEMIIAAASPQSSTDFDDDDFDDDDDENNEFSEDVTNETMEAIRHAAARNSKEEGQGPLKTGENIDEAVSSTNSPSAMTPDVHIVSDKDFEEFNLMNYVYMRSNTPSSLSNSDNSTSLAQKFDLPDISSQLVRLNKGNEIKFTAEYEHSLLEEILDENDDGTYLMDQEDDDDDDDGYI
uniref:Uncharacterized protein n=1 Tax=Ditylum brightwellii TaxID=49249 RepID=A0A7S2EWJ7_9STRA